LLQLLIATALTAVSAAACGPKVYDFPYAQEPDPRKSEYVIGVADELTVSIWRQNDLSANVVVRPDGTITLPLMGDLRAAGLTPSALKREVEKKLTAFVKDEGAVVTIAVNAVNSYRVTVSGKVARPGVIASQEYLTVADAIAAAGGPTRFASQQEVVIIRQDPKGGVRRIPVNYEELAAGRSLEQNLVLLRDDKVFVP
jgi:polysaccharide export outer membrane protein